ncbi:structure-specific endonuclease subunit SLX4-like [Pollicipes pollicipes]|uniref:structure-specific endonuclease subunit SLX4-like n=1 Tax=Pollicipes pollicipes TaxID=41117 RepID=UPI001884B97A|nr:structure-specific endonuclease subunit SLX4-like [Pollicipes pollicipes]
MLSFFRSRPELHRQILTYEPVWLEKLHQQLKAAGVKLKLAQLMDYLDEQCVTFRTESSGARRKRRSPKKASPKKRAPTQKKKSPKKTAN